MPLPPPSPPPPSPPPPPLPHTLFSNVSYQDTRHRYTASLSLCVGSTHVTVRMSSLTGLPLAHVGTLDAARDIVPCQCWRLNELSTVLGVLVVIGLSFIPVLNKQTNKHSCYKCKQGKDNIQHAQNSSIRHTACPEQFYKKGHASWTQY